MASLLSHPVQANNWTLGNVYLDLITKRNLCISLWAILNIFDFFLFFERKLFFLGLSPSEWTDSGWSFSQGTRAAVASFPKAEQLLPSAPLPSTAYHRLSGGGMPVLVPPPPPVHSKQLPQVPARFPRVDSLIGVGMRDFIQYWVSQKREMCVSS